MALQELTKYHLIEYKNGTYEPVDLHLFFKSHDSSSFVVSLFKQSCLLASRRIEDSISSEDELFFTSQVCIKRSELPALKKQLRETILNFIDDSISSEGDRVARILVGMHL
jgi:hypothetical protein